MVCSRCSATTPPPAPPACGAPSRWPAGSATSTGRRASPTAWALALRAGGDDAAGRELILRSIELARQIGNRQREATALSNVVLIHMDAEDYDRAVVAAKEATEVDRALNDPWGVAINQLNLISALLHAEGPGPARALVEEIAQDVLALDDVELSIDMVEAIAAIAASAGDAELAAGLVGAADAKREGVGMPRVMT